MATDIERSYVGTNFAVITLLVLLSLVGIYFIIANVHDAVEPPAVTDQAMPGIPNAGDGS